MRKSRLIELLNRDLADEHSAVIRYLIHAWMEGEDTPLGSNLLSRSREEMWHMHWLGMVICQLGGEPDFNPSPYPYDPSSRASIFRSYIEYEEKLIPRYYSEADLVDDSNIKRILQREAWESAIHAKKFQKILNELTPEQSKGLPEGNAKLSKNFLALLQNEVSDKYNETLQQIRYSWMFQIKGNTGWKLMDQAMEKMKHIAHFAEGVAENGMSPVFIPKEIDRSRSLKKSLKRAAQNTRSSRLRHMKLKDNLELKKHRGMVINLDYTIRQELNQAEELDAMIKGE